LNKSVIQFTFPFYEIASRRKEVYKYDMFSVLSDAGGYFGLFVGLSIWGVYQHFKFMSSKCTKFINKRAK